MTRDLAHRLQLLFDRFKEFPEAGHHDGHVLMRSDAFLAFLDARQLIEREVIPALHELEKSEE